MQPTMTAITVTAKNSARNENLNRLRLAGEVMAIQRDRGNPNRSLV